MNKKLAMLIIPLVIVVAIVVMYVVKNSREMIIQGEVETKQVDLSSKIAGRILKINVEKGDAVKKGELLITLDTPEINAKSEQSEGALEMALAQQQKANAGTRYEQVQMAQSTYNQVAANVELARKTYTRMKNLHREGVIPTQKLDEASAKYQEAQAAQRTAKSALDMARNGAQYEDKMTAGANVKRARGLKSEVNSYLKENKIKTPINGEIVDITVEEGELVAAGYPIVSIVDLSDVWVTFNLREDLLSKIKMGTEFDAKFPALDNKKIRMRVNYISVLGNYATWRATKAKGDFDMKTFEVRAVPVEKVDGLRAGMSAIVDWNRIK